MPSFRLSLRKSAAALSEHTWDLKENKKRLQNIMGNHSKIKGILINNKCDLCESEKDFIPAQKPTLNKRREILSACMHREKYLLTQAKNANRSNDVPDEPDWET
ncbi:hypothetical protein ElyMa_003630400 [Elysia marginata]|uniref:Uncharacterized protein n=1 Tax=Elysia marginata TaxID=1093978 RepID=A0AAV4ETR6_9GAST|nr:hypothetical protein ElyMa_003630400 [Elysia marginata]